MPGKSKHGKGRRAQFRNRPRQPQAAANVTNANATPAAVNPVQTAPAAKQPVRPVSQTRTPANRAAAAAEVPYIGTELKKIAIITAIIIVVIIILTFVLK